ncbi:MAG TPA: hypothetical protein VFP84_04475, partial [Kofleriaceae bacterium]|nr:hypothetical protein [Kofleriaceae bacterium]
LPFEPVATGARRFVELMRALEAQNLTRGELTVKSAARLMPATGTPAEAVRRVLLAYNQLATVGARDARTAAAVALAAMVRDDAAVGEAVHRLLAVHAELVQRRISSSELALGDALECMACAGTPAEVAETVRALVHQLAAGRAPRRADTAVAVAFAKRFAY